MLNFTVTIEDLAVRRHVHVSGELDVGNATEFSHLVRQLGEALGGAQVDLGDLVVSDAAGRSAVRQLARHAEEYGGTVCYPREWTEPVPPPAAHLVW